MRALALWEWKWRDTEVVHVHYEPLPVLDECMVDLAARMWIQLISASLVYHCVSHKGQIHCLFILLTRKRPWPLSFGEVLNISLLLSLSSPLPFISDYDMLILCIEFPDYDTCCWTHDLYLIHLMSLNFSFLFNHTFYLSFILSFHASSLNRSRLSFHWPSVLNVIVLNFLASSN